MKMPLHVLPALDIRSLQAAPTAALIAPLSAFLLTSFKYAHIYIYQQAHTHPYLSAVAV